MEVLPLHSLRVARTLHGLDDYTKWWFRLQQETYPQFVHSNKVHFFKSEGCSSQLLGWWSFDNNYFNFVGVTIFYTLLLSFQSKLELTCNKNNNNNKKTRAQRCKGMVVGLITCPMSSTFQMYIYVSTSWVYQMIMQKDDYTLQSYEQSIFQTV